MMVFNFGNFTKMAPLFQKPFYGALVRVCIFLGITLSIIAMCCIFYKCLQTNTNFNQSEFGYSYTSKRQALDSSSSYLEEEFP